MKFKMILPFLFTILGSLTSQADRIGNGGDVCESRIQTIRNDISAWITKNGSAALKLPKGLPLAQFNTSMMNAFTKTSVACVDENLFVGAAEKTCKNMITQFGKSLIQCNYARFMATTETEQYMLIHHEYAGVAGFEVNSGEESDYAISRQITGYLQDQVVKRLVVRSTYSPSGRAKAFQGTEGEVIIVIPLNNNSKILISAQNTYGINDDKVMVYDMRGTPAYPEAGFPLPARPRAFTTVLSRIDNQLFYTDNLTLIPQIIIKEIKLEYSEELSKTIIIQKLLDKAQDFVFPTSANISKGL